MILLGILEDIENRKQQLTMYDIMYITIELTKLKIQIYKIDNLKNINDNEYIKKIENIYKIIIDTYFNNLKLEYKNFNFVNDSNVYKLYNDIYLQGWRCLYSLKNEDLENLKRNFLCDLANIGFEIEKVKFTSKNEYLLNIEITDKQFENLLSGYNKYVANYMNHSVEFQYVITIFKEIKYIYLKKQLIIVEEN